MFKVFSHYQIVGDVLMSAVPTCTRMHCITKKNSTCQVSKVVIRRIRTFLLFNIA